MVAESVTVRFIPRPAESLRAYRFTNQGVHRLLTVLPAIAFITGLFPLLFIGWPDAAPVVVPMWAVALSLLVLEVALPAASSRLALRRYPQLWREEAVVMLDDAGLHATRGALSTDIGWAGITDYIENQEFIVLRQGRLLVVVIPARAFADPADRAAFVAVLRTHLARPAGTQ